MINYIYIVMEEMPLCYDFFSLPLIKLGFIFTHSNNAVIFHENIFTFGEL